MRGVLGGGGEEGGQLVICNGGMWGRLTGTRYSLSRRGKKKKEGQAGLGPLSLRRWRGGRRVPVAYFRFLETSDELSPLSVTLLNKV